MISPREYVTDQVSTILGVPVILNEGQVSRFWSLLTREEERRSKRDVHGNFKAEESILGRLRLLEYPPLHQDIVSLVRHLGPLPPRWPKGHRFAACLTHDVDRIVKLPWRERWRQFACLWKKASPWQCLRWIGGSATYALGACAGKSDLATFDFWLDEEKRWGFHSTFFVLPESLAQPTTHDHFYYYHDTVVFRGQRMPFTEAIRQVRASGWEIGLHGSYASADDAEILQADKQQVERILGEPVQSTRQHYLRFDADVTPRIQAAAGIRVDSTLGYSTTIGCRSGLAFPYYWPLEQELLEVPLSIQDVGLLRGRHRTQTLDAVTARARALITHIADIGGVVTLSWHTHPESPDAHQCYRALLQTIADLGGWGCSMSELADWWQLRRTMVKQHAATSTHQASADIHDRIHLHHHVSPP
ncbi:MAG: polysaccharide deacetylase family protein [Armatimonadota bacterium]